MTRPLLGLVAIVKNEAVSIARTLESVRAVVDHCTVLDTGSSDETRDVVAKVGQEIWPGTKHVWCENFVDYATARNRVLEIERTCRAESAEYALSLSADEVLHGGEHLRTFLQSYEGEESAFLVEVRTTTGAFDYPRVLKVAGPWRYEGEIHEMPVHQVERDRKPVVKIPGSHIEYVPTDPARFAKRLRERDLPLLCKQLTEAVDAATRARVILLLAQTREQLVGTYQDDIAGGSQEMFSALGWYAYLSMDGKSPPDVRQHAAWKYLNVAEALGVYLPYEMVARLQPIVQADPGNPAAAYMLARHTAAVDENGVVRGDPRAALHAAQKAAKAARDAVVDPAHPHDPHGLLWRSHFLAALCAKALGHGPTAKRSAEAGIAGGAPEGVFEEFLK